VVDWVAPNNHVLGPTLGLDAHVGRGSFCRNAVYRKNMFWCCGSLQIALGFLVYICVRADVKVFLFFVCALAVMFYIGNWALLSEEQAGHRMGN